MSLATGRAPGAGLGKDGYGLQRERGTKPGTAGPPEVALAEEGTEEQSALPASGGSRPEQR